LRTQKIDNSLTNLFVQRHTGRKMKRNGVKEPLGGIWLKDIKRKGGTPLPF
jgi:hypothetical protein